MVSPQQLMLYDMFVFFTAYVSLYKENPIIDQNNVRSGGNPHQSVGLHLRIAYHHDLITGTTGAGKTVTLHVMAESYAGHRCSSQSSKITAADLQDPVHPELNSSSVLPNQTLNTIIHALIPLYHEIYTVDGTAYSRHRHRHGADVVS
jgi:hypothetical protein